MQAAHFDIRAVAEPQTLPRLISHFAQLGLIPSRVQAEEADGMMNVIIEQADLMHSQANVVAAKMRASVLVEFVTVFHDSEPGSRQAEEPS